MKHTNRPEKIKMCGSLSFVSDKGIGIPEVDQEKIFEHFYRAHNVGMIAGTGLGMAIIKNSIDILGGTIQLTSVENQGTIVRVKLPISTG